MGGVGVFFGCLVCVPVVPFFFAWYVFSFLEGGCEAFFVQSQEDMNFDGAGEITADMQKKASTAHATAARRVCAAEGGCSCGVEHGGEHRWTARDRAVTARMVQYLDTSECLEVDIEELDDSLLGPEEFEVARGEKHRRLFHAFSVQGLSDFLVASVAPGDENTRMLEIHEQESLELRQSIKYMSERQEKLG